MKTPKNSTPSAAEPERVAKVIARAGVSSRREAEAMIAEGRVALNGVVLDTPAVTVKPGDVVSVDGQPLPERERTRLWMFHKPRGLVTTTHDPEGRRTVFDVLPDDLPRVMTVGRLDINTEGLLLLTNDGGLSRVLELPATGWLRRYRVRAHGAVEQADLDALRDGVAIDGILYGAVEATLDSRKGDNVWLTVGLREGKNREVKNILAHLGLDVNRLIRLSFGPFQLGDLAEGAVEEVPRRVLKEQLGERLAGEAGADFRLREGERQPERQRGLGIAEQAAPRDQDERPPEAKGKVARAPRRPDAARSRHRHEADIEHNADTRQGRGADTRQGRGADTRQGRGGERATGRDMPQGRPAPRALDAGGPKRRATEERREPAPPPNAGRNRLGAAKPEALTPDRPKRLDRAKRETEAAETPRAHRTGRAFEVARKPKPEPAERTEAPRGALKSRGSLSHGGGPDAPSRARGSRSHGTAAERDGGRAAPRPVADERPRGRRAEPDTGGFRPRTDAIGGDEFERREARTGGPAGKRPGRGGGEEPRPRRPGGEESRFRRAGGDEPRAGGRSDKPTRAAAGEERRARAPRPSAVEGGPKAAGPKTAGRGEARGPRAAEPRAGRPCDDRTSDERPRTERPRTERPKTERSRGDTPAAGGKPRAGKPGGGKPAAGGPKPSGPGGRPGGGKPRGPHADRRR